jgi:hypothetical protein
MKFKNKYFLNNTWNGVLLSILFALCYFIFIASCFVMEIISLAKEFEIGVLLNKILPEKTSVFLIERIPRTLLRGGCLYFCALAVF